MKIIPFVLLACALRTMPLHGQASPTASRRFDLQAGGGFTLVRSDYYPEKFRGGAVYAALDFSPHLGAEIDFHQANSPVDNAYERTYEVGARYHRTYGRFMPYAKVLYGRGVFNFVFSGVTVANLAYNEYVLGGGVDYRLLSFLNVRGDYEHQTWLNFEPHHLSPDVITIGVAYHFPARLQKGRRFR